MEVDIEEQTYISGVRLVVSESNHPRPRYPDPINLENNILKRFII